MIWQKFLLKNTNAIVKLPYLQERNCHSPLTKMMDNLYLDKLKGRISDGDSVRLGDAGQLNPTHIGAFKHSPAFSAGPFLATVMDILGILIYCYVTKLLLF